LDLARASVSDILADGAANAATLGEWGVPTPRSFAFPYGEVAQPAKAVLSSRFASLRALHPGIVRGECDLNQLPAVGVEGRSGEETAAVWLESALRERAWIILYTHDVQRSPSPWGCTPEALANLITMARVGGAEIVTVGEVVARHAKLSVAA
jgi:peptidoglycan/xylan/chitin deacetylase (PgdA/CDA1 family)